MRPVSSATQAPGQGARRSDAHARAVDRARGPAGDGDTGEDGGVDVALRDGSTLHVRPVRDGDEAGMRSFFDDLSTESLGLRFFGVPNRDWVTKWAVDVEHADRHALVATAGPSHRIVAHGAYVRLGADRAEVAFVVADAWQGHGIATIMLGQLAASAHAEGISVFIAEVLPHNHRMINVFRDSGLPIELRGRGDVIELRFPTSLSEEALVQFERREAIAAAAAIASILAPASVTVIGASRRRGSIGGEVLRNLLAAGFTGPVYPVNRNAVSVAGLPAFASIADVRARIELAIVAVAAGEVAEVARACGAAGVRALVVLSGGFAENGADGAARERELLAICRESGMRLIGPNSLGVLSADPAAPLHATFAGPMPPPGCVGMLSQSVGLGITMLEHARSAGLGLSSFVSVGNRADISGNDLLQYWEQDQATTVAALYLESFGNPRRFARVARRFSRVKPIVALKGGRSPAGARVAGSRTGALLEASDVTVDALFEQAGVIRADTIDELFDVVALLAAQPAPAGPRVAIVANGGGAGVLAADACQAAGLDVAELAPALTRRLQGLLPRAALLDNPIDMLASASPRDYRRAIDAIVEARAADAILAIHVRSLDRDPGEVAAEIHDTAQRAGAVAIASVFMGCEPGGAECPREESSVPRYALPEPAARALGHAARYGGWRARPAGELVGFADARPDEAAAVIVTALAGGDGWLSGEDTAALLDCYGLPLLRGREVRSVEAAVAAAAEVAGPVALKAIVPPQLRRGELGGVRLGLETAAELRRAASDVRAALAAAGVGVEALLVQPMAPAGVELTVGVTHDSSFGPVIVCGAPAGGTSARITPLSDLDARDMTNAMRAPEPCDGAAIEQVLLRLSALVEAHAEIAEIDLHPLVCSPGGAIIVDARVRVEAAPPAAPVSALRG